MQTYSDVFVTETQAYLAESVPALCDIGLSELAHAYWALIPVEDFVDGDLDLLTDLLLQLRLHHHLCHC